MSRRAFAAAADLAPSEAEWGSLLVGLYRDRLACSTSAPRPAISPAGARATQASRPA
jgi:hypothetical protein